MNIKSVLAILAVAGFFAVLTALFLVPIPQANGQMINTVIVALISIVSAIVGYYFGSSEGSSKKSDLLAQIAAPPPDDRSALPAKEAGFARLRLLVPLAFLMLFLTALATMYGCATTGTGKQDTPQAIAARSLLSSRQAIIAAAGTADTFCTQGVLKQGDCDRAKDIYGQAQAAYNVAADAFLLYIQTGDAKKYEEALPRLMTLTLDLDTFIKSTGGAK